MQNPSWNYGKLMHSTRNLALSIPGPAPTLPGLLRGSQCLLGHWGFVTFRPMISVLIRRSLLVISISCSLRLQSFLENRNPEVLMTFRKKRDVHLQFIGVFGSSLS